MTGGATLQNQFTQTDPMPLGAGSAFESSYVYALNNPQNFIDPSGLRGQKSGFSKQVEAAASQVLAQVVNVSTLDNTVGACATGSLARPIGVILGASVAGSGCFLDDGHRFGIAPAVSLDLSAGLGVGGRSVTAGWFLSNAKNMTSLVGYSVCGEVNLSVPTRSGTVAFCYSLDSGRVGSLENLSKTLPGPIPDDWIQTVQGRRVWSLYVGLGRGASSGSAVNANVGYGVTWTPNVYGYEYDPGCRTATSGAVRTLLGWPSALPTGAIGLASCAYRALAG